MRASLFTGYSQAPALRGPDGLLREIIIDVSFEPQFLGRREALLKHSDDLSGGIDQMRPYEAAAE